MVTCTYSITVVYEGQDLLVLGSLIVLTPDAGKAAVQFVACHLVSILYCLFKSCRSVRRSRVGYLVLDGVDLVVGQRVATPVKIDA